MRKAGAHEGGLPRLTDRSKDDPVEVTLMMGKAPDRKSLRERRKFPPNSQSLHCLQLRITHMPHTGKACPEPPMGKGLRVEAQLTGRWGWRSESGGARRRR